MIAVPTHRSNETAARVRTNVVPAMIAAVLMTLYGFFYLAEPTGTDLFSRSAWVFYHTLRIGGGAMGALALWSLTGQRHALAADAIVSCLIGASLILTGAGMLIDGGGALQSILNGVFGFMFVKAGINNGRAFAALPSVERDDRPVTTRPARAEDGTSWLAAVKTSARRAGEATPTPASHSSPEAIGGRVEDPRVESAPAPRLSSPGRSEPRREGKSDNPVSACKSGHSVASDPPVADEPIVTEGQSDASPAEGFLASFAEKRPPQQ